MQAAVNPKVAIVTGASRGIGRAVAHRLVAEGWAVALVARSAQALRDVQAHLPQSQPIVADLLAPDAPGRVVEQTMTRFGRIDALINNAGVGGAFERVEQFDVSEWQRVQQLNVVAPMLLCRSAIPQMRTRGWGRIVNVGSIFSHASNAGSSAYAASKHALLGLTRTLAVECGGAGITCNSVCPGYIQTEMLDWMTPEDRAAAIAATPVGRLGTPDDVAAVVAMLVREDMGYINGASIMIDGGLTAKLA